MGFQTPGPQSPLRSWSELERTTWQPRNFVWVCMIYFWVLLAFQFKYKWSIHLVWSHYAVNCSAKKRKRKKNEKKRKRDKRRRYRVFLFLGKLLAWLKIRKNDTTNCFWGKNQILAFNGCPARYLFQVSYWGRTLETECD